MRIRQIEPAAGRSSVRGSTQDLRWVELLNATRRMEVTIRTEWFPSARFSHTSGSCDDRERFPLG